MKSKDNPTLGRPAYNIFWRIHKAVRSCLCDTMLKVGRVDSDDQQELELVLDQVRGMLAFCKGHLAHENQYIHTAMEARNPGSTHTAAEEHQQHERAFIQIEALVAQVVAAAPDVRGQATAQLYQYLALFVGENLVHMYAEETHDHGVLGSAYNADELGAIEGRIVASLTPQQRGLSMQWMLPALTPQERALLLAVAA
jgi:hypothetical protein